MANNNKKNAKNVNQPRRKRNKKPVKRYSEEYSNRPNPYTGYSADGNYHPEAKKLSIDDASAAKSIQHTEDYVVLTDKSEIKDTTESEIIETTASAEATACESSENDTAAPVDIKDSKSTSHRKKDVDRDAAKKAQVIKTEARRVAVDKIAKGVAAHSVSEQIIDDIASMTDVIESLALAESEKSQKEKEDYISESTEIPEPIIKKNESETSVEASEADEESIDEQENEIEIARPVELGENDELPFDVMKAETKENISEPDTEEAQSKTTEKTEQEKSEAVSISPLDPSDLIPILDFDKPSAPVLKFSEPSSDSDKSEQTAAPSEEITTATIEEILQAVEKEKLDTIKKAEQISANSEFEFGSDVIFDTSKSDNWDNVIIPPLNYDDESEIVSDETDAAESSEEILNNLLDMCFNSDDNVLKISENASDEENNIFDIDETLSSDSDSTSADTETEEKIPSSDEIFNIIENESDTINDIFSIENEASSEAVNITEESPSEADDISVITEEAENYERDSDQDHLPTVEEAIGSQSEQAVNEKIKKLVEAAELAEILRQENEETEIVAESKAENTEPTDNSLGIKNHGEEISDTLIESETDEIIKEYSPIKNEKKLEADDVFESVLIVDDNDKALDTDAENQDESLFLHEKGPVECPTAIFKLPEGPIILPTDVDDGDFQEQWLDDEEDGDEMASRNKRTRRRISAFIGAVTIVFAVMILVGVVKTAVLGINSIGSTNEKKVEYTEFISPVVINDPAPFDSIDEANNQMLLESAIWSVLDSRDDDNYEYDATGKIVLSADDVAASGRKLFGNNVKLKMDVLSESDGSALYYYDSIENNFHISTGGIIGPSVSITKIAQKSDYISLIVGYYSQNDINAASSEEIEFYKYMEYILAFNEDGSYYIESIRNYTEE